MEIATPSPINSRDPFLVDREEEGPQVELEAAKHAMTIEREALDPRRRSPSQRGKQKNINLVVEAVLKNPKKKGKLTSPAKSKSQIVVSHLRGA